MKRVLLVASMLGAVSCGTKIDTGSNEEQARIQNQKQKDKVKALGGQGDDEELEIEVGDWGYGSEDATGSSGGSGSDLPPPSSSSGYKMTCFGSLAPDQQLPPAFKKICEETPEDIQNDLSMAFNYICNEKRVNWLYPPCGWNGEGDADDRAKFMRIVDMTDLEDSSAQDFDFFAVSSATSFSTPAEHYELVKRELQDPTFKDQFVTMDGVIASNAVQIDETTMQAHLKIQSSAATSEMTVEGKSFIDLDPDGKVIMIVERSIGDEVVILKHAVMRIYVEMPDGRSRIFVADQKKIDAAGQLSLAFQTIWESFDFRVRAEVENSKLD